MAAKRSTVEARAAKGDAKAFTVVLEDLRSRFEVFGEALQGLREHMDARFEQVDRRFEQVDHELGLVKVVLLEHGRKLTQHGRELGAIRQELREVRDEVKNVGTKVDAKVDHTEVKRIVDVSLSKRRQSRG